MRQLWYSVVSLVLAFAVTPAFSGDRVNLPKWPTPKGEACVEPVDIMRRQHMEFIIHQRDETVHNGIRGAKHSLVDCIDCHVGYDEKGKAVAIDEEGQFCAACHEYTAVSIDCFSCHRTTPPDSNRHMTQTINHPDTVNNEWISNNE